MIIMDALHCATGHSHEVLRRKTADQLGIVLEGEPQERRQRAPAAGDTGDGKAERIGSSQGGAVDTSSALVGKAESKTSGSPQGSEVDVSSAPAGRTESEAIGSSQGGAVDTSAVQVERAERNLSAASNSGIDHGNDKDSPAVLSGREAHELNDWGSPPATVRGRIRDQSQRLEG